MITNSRSFYVNSTNRTSGVNGSFSYTIQLPSNEKFNRVVMLDCLIPKSYYLIDATRNQFTLTENGVNTIITIPPGNYNRRSFMAMLAPLLTSSSSQVWTYTITYPPTATGSDTGKYTYTVTGNAGVQPSFTFGTTGPFEQLGFARNTTNTFVGSTITSNNVLKFQAEDALYLHSSIATNGRDDVLQQIYVSAAGDFSNIHFECPDIIAYSKRLSYQTSNNYTFTLTDEDNSVIFLNGLNMNFTILVFQLDDAYNLWSDYIKYNLVK